MKSLEHEIEANECLAKMRLESPRGAVRNEPMSNCYNKEPEKNDCIFSAAYYAASGYMC